MAVGATERGHLAQPPRLTAHRLATMLVRPPTVATNRRWWRQPRTEDEAMPTTGLFNERAPVDPSNTASPKEKMPPSLATSQ
jgi:hypothetical protein